MSCGVVMALDVVERAVKRKYETYSHNIAEGELMYYKAKEKNRIMKLLVLRKKQTLDTPLFNSRYPACQSNGEATKGRGADQ